MGHLLQIRSVADDTDGRVVDVDTVDDGLQLTPSATIGISYAGHYGDSTSDSAIRGRLDYRF